MLAEATAAAPHDRRWPSRAPHILGITLPREGVGEGGGAAERMPRSLGPRRGAQSAGGGAALPGVGAGRGRGREAEEGQSDPTETRGPERERPEGGEEWGGAGIGGL